MSLLFHCDKCGTEIKDKYYTVNIYSYDTNPQHYYYDATGCASSASSSREDILRTLNSIKMYCKDCRDKIEEFINNT